MPQFLAPATPSELLAHIIAHQAYPTTLIVCCSRAEFQIALLRDAASVLSSAGPQGRSDDTVPGAEQQKRVKELVAAPLYQTAVAKHIRILFAPTVSHLRIYLSVFAPADSKIPAPPDYATSNEQPSEPLLLLYGFLDAHRDTSEWNAQGLSCTASILVDAAHRTSFEPIIIEPKGDDGHPALDTLLTETVPLLNNTTVSEGSWSGRTVEIRRVLGRWFEFHDRPMSQNKELDVM
ncbi:hypothetical protein jhhlp_003904 [Lomentospora prolificans]|uniref:Uncharacterized protein n=1 Tax=Lomentospora prolificans TaxID=41688 RepID=A0A2N3NA30_9PEZI|nr:hypothetical protein jhhlp_003904 [Lomentospora prolificans]